MQVGSGCAWGSWPEAQETNGPPPRGRQLIQGLGHQLEISTDRKEHMWCRTASGPTVTSQEKGLPPASLALPSIPQLWSH